MDFESTFGNINLDDVKDVILPPGTYKVEIMNVTWRAPKNEGDSGVFLIATRPVDHREDVSESDLPDDWRDSRLYLRVYVEIDEETGAPSKGDVLKLKKLLTKAGVETRGRNLDKEFFAGLRGGFYLDADVAIKYRDDDGEPFNAVNSTAAAAA